MKVATLTFQGAYSYGALLQAYALQNAIRSLGYDTEIIGYSCSAIEEDYGFPRTFRGIVGRVLRTPFFQIRQRRFDSFRRQHLVISKDVTKSNISSAAVAYDAVVVGSDQVWNPEITGNDSTYYLDFCLDGQRRVAYAASMGISAWDEKTECKNLGMLSGFDCLSVREKTARKYLLSQGIDAEVVCDPTFLIIRECYLDLIKETSLPKKYTLLLCLQNPYAKSIEFARDVARKREESLVVLHTGWHRVNGAKNIRAAGPSEFVTAIYKASCVITESFHGVCFSIIFNKNFYYFDPRSTEKRKERTSRITDLLIECGLEARDSRAGVCQLDDIDYREINKRLAQIRQRSADFLAASLDMEDASVGLRE